MGLDGVLGNEELRRDLTIAAAAGDQGEDFELARRDAEGLLLGCVGSEGFAGRGFRGGFRGNQHFPHHDRLADGFAAPFATMRDAEAEPDAEGRKEYGDERSVELDGVFDDDEAVFGVLQRGDKEAADKTEDEDVALHDGVVKKYIPGLATLLQILACRVVHVPRASFRIIFGKRFPGHVETNYTPHIRTKPV